MDLFQLMQMIKKNKVFILLVLLLSGIIGFCFAYFSSEKYDVSVDFMIAVSNKQQGQDFQYDGYYEMRSSDYVAQTVMSWFKTPSFVFNIYDVSGVHRPKVHSLNKLGRLFKTSQLSAQNIGIRFKNQSKDDAGKIASTIIKLVEKKAQDLSRDYDGNPLFYVAGENPVILMIKPNPILFAFVSSLISAILLVMGLPIYMHFNSRERES